MRHVLVFVFSALFLALGMDRTIGAYDEGVVLTGAMRVAAGEVPHRDFYANYGPAEFYLLAFLFKLFGEQVWVERALDVLVRAAIVALSYGLAASYARTSIAVVAALVCGLWLFSLAFYGYPVLPVIALFLVSARLVLPVMGGRSSPWRRIGAGAAIGLAALFRYDVGFFAFVAFAAALVISGFDHPDRTDRGARAAAGMLIPFATGTAVVFLVPAILYLSVAPLSFFIRDIFAFSIVHYERMRGLPFPWPRGSASAVYLPVLVCIAAAYTLIRDRGHAPSPQVQRGRQFVILLTLIAASLYVKGLVRVSVPHMIASLIPSVILLAVLIERARHQDRRMRAIAFALSMFAVGTAVQAATETARSRIKSGLTVASALLEGGASSSSDDAASWCGASNDVPRVVCFRAGPERLEIARFLIQHTRPDERVFVGLGRHDKIFINDNLIYFAAGRLPATRWHHFDPGLQTSAHVQAEIIRELETRNVRYVVLSSEWDHVAEPNDSAKSSGVFDLDEYIRRNYERVQTHGGLSLLMRMAGERTPPPEPIH